MRIKSMLSIILAFIAVFTLPVHPVFGQEDDTSVPKWRLSQNNKITIGEKIEIHSEILNEDRDLLIYLPDNYDHTQAKYPVIYLLDGYFFFLSTSAIIDYLSRINNMPKMIVVAITNTDRLRDFSPAPRGGAEKFTSFLKNELIPFVDDNYRTEKFSVFAGHSLGGYFVVYTLLNEPHLFNAYIAMSPALHWNRRSEVTKAGEVLNSEISLKKYLYLTYSKGDGNNISSTTDKLVNILKTQSPRDLKWEFAFMPNDMHNSTPLRSVHTGLEFLFSRWAFHDWDNPGKMIEHYRSLSEEFGFVCKPTESLVVSFARRQVNKGNIPEAIKVYQYNTEIYPLSARAFESLGDTYIKAENIVLAKKNYEKSLKLNPNNARVKDKMAKLKDK
ncbi:MAG: hypothetical protein GY863_12810 [bacterium]|nr:hypothetical protein [bacterium]